MSIAEAFTTMAYGPAPESRDPALHWIEEKRGPMKLYIGGEWRPPIAGEYFDVVNPGTGMAIASVPQADAADVDQAVQAARAAFEGWSALSGHERARHLYALARAVQRQSRLFAVLESLDNGKPIRESRDIDIPLVARHFYHHAGWAQLRDTEFPGRRPVGIVGQIIPWNFPLLMLAWKIAPALAMGNTVVLKPAEFTPLTALAFAEVVQRAGLPAGVVNIVTGDGRSGEAIVRHPDVNKIAFTGSTEVGRIIRRETAGTGKKLSLELGGKSPFLVFDDADLDSVVEGLVDAIWFNQGQVCCAGSRLLVQESVERKLIAKVRARMEKLRMGDPLDKAIDIGAIVAPVQLQRIRDLVDQGIREGAELWQPSWACPEEGYFYPPTLFTNVAPAATVAQVEIFGPVLVSMTFRTPSEAVALANNTRYGLAASVWSENINLALDVARQIKAGTVWINSTNLFDAASGFGGYRESGFGREGGKEGLYEYLELVVPPASSHLERQRDVDVAGDSSSTGNGPGPGRPAAVDRTAKMYIGGKQARPDSGYSREVQGADGAFLQEVGDGNRKDIRNAVEAAHAASKWGDASGHARAQVLYYIAENLSVRAREFAARLDAMTACGLPGAKGEVEDAIETLFTCAAWADKFDGSVHNTQYRNVTLAMQEAIGVIGIICPPELPLLAFVTAFASAIAMGNVVVIVPSEVHPLAATDFYQVLETSDVPPGVVNIVTGDADSLASVLADHDDVDAVWYFRHAPGCTMVERASAGNMKRTWVPGGAVSQWFPARGEIMREFLHQGTQVKNIWVPYGI
ncbi:MAG: aldehyde dehydrogenase family protein [Chloroflexota bacterium]